MIPNFPWGEEVQQLRSRSSEEGSSTTEAAELTPGEGVLEEGSVRSAADWEGGSHYSACRAELTPEEQTLFQLDYLRGESTFYWT